ncbi:hypothetical protein PV328_001102 [Microctonus aethiopoides]|uniref:Uncharacterized protein n=1 Tax=Microctonus aethiopoides TaxID=144406 RepID=A0AA39KX53_9HYME|nr:hypothetical protein PV328_001102 [Microctonus aethiopoides]
MLINWCTNCKRMTRTRNIRTELLSCVEYKCEKYKCGTALPVSEETDVLKLHMIAQSNKSKKVANLGMEANKLKIGENLCFGILKTERRTEKKVIYNLVSASQDIQGQKSEKSVFCNYLDFYRKIVIGGYYEICRL